MRPAGETVQTGRLRPSAPKDRTGNSPPGGRRRPRHCQPVCCPTRAGKRAPTAAAIRRCPPCGTLRSGDHLPAWAGNAVETLGPYRGFAPSSATADDPVTLGDAADYWVPVWAGTTDSRLFLLAGMPVSNRPVKPGDDDHHLSKAKNSVRRCHEAGFGHQLLVQGFVLLKKLHHVGAGEEARLQGLLLHIVLVLGGVGDLAEQIEIEGRHVWRDLSGQEDAAQHRVLHIEP